MKCPACVSLDMTSCFHQFRAEPVRDVVERFWDEAGVAHVHDRTKYKAVFACDNGHSYMQESRSRCPLAGCAWNEQDLVKNGEKKPGEG